MEKLNCEKPKVNSILRSKKWITRSRISISRDRPVLLFVWKWKVVTTQAIFIRFRSEFNWTASTVYNRLSILRAKGFIQLLRENGKEGRVWALTALGFQLIRHELPALREEGFGSENMAHDILVLAAHLGEWIEAFPLGKVSLVTEQQLRRYDKDFLPSWVPTSETHRPDGYWRLLSFNPERTIALEVERTGKGSEPYRKIGSFYNDEHKVDFVIWIVDSEQTLERIVKTFKSASYGYRDIHNFMWLSDFISYGWHAPIVFGPNRGHKLIAFLSEQNPGTDRAHAGHDPVTSMVPSILDVVVKRRNYSKTNAPTNSKIP